MWKSKSKKIVELNSNKYKQIIESMKESVWVWDKDKNTIYANPNFCKLVEYSLEEMVNMKSIDFWDDESIITLKEHQKKRARWEKSIYEGNLKSKSWKLIPVFLSGTPLPWGWNAWIMTDLREIKVIKEAEYKLANSNKKLESQLDKIIKLKIELDRQISALNNSAIVLETDDDFKIITFNKYFETISWYHADELLWEKYNLFEEGDYSKVKNSFLKVIKSGNIWKWEVKSKDKSWNIYWMHTTVTPFADKNWTIYKYVFISNDISEIKRLGETKTEFVNIASHELRTPMTVIKWYISMIMEWDAWPINNNVKNFLNKMFENVSHLLNLVNDMLDIAKLESWKMTYFDEEFEIYDFLLNIYWEFELLMKEKWVKYNLDIDPFIKWWKIYADKSKIKQVIVNLIGNAYKFTEAWKSVTLKISVDSWKLLFEVIDTGIWIPKDQYANVFKKFQQIDSSLQRKTTGTWLWLNICQKIINNYWSQISIKSKDWEWSTFYFSLSKA